MDLHPVDPALRRALCARFLALLVAVIGMVGVSAQAVAHPHVFVSVNADLLFDETGRIKSVGNVWQFDEAFTAFAVEGLDANRDGKLDTEELQPLAQVNVESLADFAYFTFLTIDGKEQSFLPPVQYWLEHDGIRLTLFFTLPLDLPAAVGRDTTLEIFDPEYFVAFDFPGEQPLALVDAPAGCTATYHPPKGLEADAMAILNALPMDQRELPPDLQALADDLADMFTVDCPGTEVAAAVTGQDTPRATGRSPFGIVTPDGGGGAAMSGPFGSVFAWIAARQSEFYRTLTDSLISIKQDGTAFWLLLLVAFLYGVFHAAGPGHGKAVITAYVLASGDTVKRGVAISFAAAFVQAVSAIVIVGLATLVIGATAQQITGMTNWVEIASYAAIVLLGLWLVWTKAMGGGHHHHHHHHHHGMPGHDHAGHRHEGNGRRLQRRDLGAAAVTMPEDLDEAAARRSAIGAATPSDATPAPECAPVPRHWLARAWAAILSVGIRPCSGAIIILVFALSQGLVLAGITATFVMALGTGLTVAILATIAVSAKGLAMRYAVTGTSGGGIVLRVVEIGGALAVLLFGLLLLGGALYPMV